MTSFSDVSREAVTVSVPDLVRLRGPGAGLPLKSGRVLARQAGEYRSPFKGRGMEFDESRPYQPGDDIRNIDWRVTARTGKPHSKLFREERERPVFLWVDLRRSMFFATRGRYKAVQAARIAALLGWAAVHHGDRVGGVVFSDDTHRELKPQRGKAAVLRYIKNLVHHPAWNGAAPAAEDADMPLHALARLRRVVRPGSLVFLVSDFRQFNDAARAQIAHLGRHNDVIMIFIYDPIEQDLPPPGRYVVTDGGTEYVLDTTDAALVRAHRERFARHRDELLAFSRRHRIYLMESPTSADPLAFLRSGLVAGIR